MKNNPQPVSIESKQTHAVQHVWGERGQTTAEYALVLLAAGTIAMVAVSWAQGSGAISELFDTILRRITSLLG